MACTSDQLALPMRIKGPWGGRRAGAGRKPAVVNVRHVPHLRRGALNGRVPCHVTLRLRPGLPSLRTRRFVSAFEAGVRALRARGDFRVKGRVLRERYHLRKLQTPREVRSALAYVLLNARKHLAERVGPAAARRAAAGTDPASSGRWFSGWRRAFAVPDKTGPPPPVAAARSWLLSVGWLRHGRIDPAEVPGRLRLEADRAVPANP